MNKLSSLLLVIVAMAGGHAFAQSPSWSPEQADVWAVVAASWVDDVAENGKWPADYTHANFVSWGSAMPAPRGRDAAIDWSRFSDENNTTIKYENTPLAIAVAGDTAVVNYVSVTVTEDSEGEHDQDVAGIVEVLTRDRDEWKYLSTTGFELDFDD